MINNLEEKLSGLEPITREELIKLVNSWGRKESFDTIDDICVEDCDADECYPLENLDVSQIDDLSSVFDSSLYNGNLSKWNVFNCKNMHLMFFNSNFNNDSLKNWNVSNVTNMEKMFSNSKFNGDISFWNIINVENINMIFESSLFEQDISSWKFNKDIYLSHIFYNNENFKNKYNNGNKIPDNKKDFIEWFQENREKMKEINTPKEEVLDFFSFNNNIELNKN